MAQWYDSNEVLPPSYLRVLGTPYNEPDRYLVAWWGDSKWHTDFLENAPFFNIVRWRYIETKKTRAGKKFRILSPDNLRMQAGDILHFKNHDGIRVIEEDDVLIGDFVNEQYIRNPIGYVERPVSKPKKPGLAQLIRRLPNTEMIHISPSGKVWLDQYPAVFQSIAEFKTYLATLPESTDNP